MLFILATLFVGLSGTNLPSHFVPKFKSVTVIVNISIFQSRAEETDKPCAMCSARGIHGHVVPGFCSLLCTRCPT